MASQQIDPTRIQRLNDQHVQAGRYVLYWMQAAQRAEHNPALEHAVRQANALDLPLVVGFGLMGDYPEANRRHYTFMLEGLADVEQALAQRRIKLIVQHGRPDQVALALAKDAAMVVADRGYLRHQKQWREQVAIHAPCAVDQVEGEVVVPVEVASDKAEFAARTLRPKIHRHMNRYMVELRPTPPKHNSLGLKLKSEPIDDTEKALAKLNLDNTVPAVAIYKGGPRQAKRLLRAFIDKHLGQYKTNRNRPETDDVSHMSKYLHFGHISPVQLALKVRHAKAGAKDDRSAFIEELLVRRELACNFVHFTANYDQYKALPPWARQTLDQHRDDTRPMRYSLAQLEQAKTDDPYWNAAMREMVYTGYMHNHMRMYWGKKLLEWSSTPENGFETTLHLNNKYFIDGRDPNSFANVGWVFGLHDRPWQEREVFGKVRYMNANGLRRKCDIEGYIKKVDRLVEQLGAP
jgi:deoxyribodipyrimidine photo-lyase